MGDSWEYRVLFEYAGMTPPNFHEDAIQAVIDGLGDLWQGICHAENDVNSAIKELDGAISSEAFDTISQRWTQDGKPSMTQVWLTIADFQTGLGTVLVMIEEFKANLVLAVGAMDIVHSLKLASIGEGIVNIAKGEYETLIQGKQHRHQLKSSGAIYNAIQDLIQEFEQKVASTIVNGTPLGAYEEKFAQNLQTMISKALKSAGAAAGRSQK